LVVSAVVAIAVLLVAATGTAMPTLGADVGIPGSDANVS
jgi:hypothetical protein